MKNELNWWKESLIDLFEEFRREYVYNDEYRGLDLNFDTLFCMKTGLSLELFNELNNMSHKYNKNK